MNTRQHAGTWTALITPFKDGAIDWPAVENLVELQIQGGVTGILVIGTTGESPTLSEEEGYELIRKVKAQAAGRCLVMAGSGTNSTEKSITKSQKCAEAGADVLMLVNPYYNKPTQEGLYLHFTKVAQSVDKPVLLYNIKGRTGVNLETDTLVRIAKECPNVIAVKEASGDMGQMKEVIARRPEIESDGRDFVVLSGDDGLTQELIQNGGDGVISVASNIVPAKVSAMVQAGLEGDSAKATQINNELSEMFDQLFIETNPIPVKYAAHKMQLCDLEYRLPMCEPSAASKEVLDELLTKHELL